MNLTIFIPTHRNRTLFLKRQLLFYEMFNFKGNIIVGDSSELEVLNKNIELCNNFKGLNIKHIIYPKEEFPYEAHINNNVVNIFETDFVCFSGDDDFQIPSTLEYCINFLKYNQQYIGAHGSKLRYILSDNRIHNVSIVKGQYMDINNPIFRFRGYMKTHTSPQYHVMRTETWKYIYSFVNELPNVKFLISEILPSSLYYISGKVRRFDNIIQYIMEQNPDSPQNTTPDYIINGINSQSWGECSAKIREIIINELIKKDCNYEESKRAFDEEFNYRILSHFNDQFIALYKKSFEEFNIKYNEHQQKYDSENNMKDTTVNEAIQSIFPALKEYLKEKIN